MFSEEKNPGILFWDAANKKGSSFLLGFPRPNYALSLTSVIKQDAEFHTNCRFVEMYVVACMITGRVIPLCRVMAVMFNHADFSQVQFAAKWRQTHFYLLCFPVLALIQPVLLSAQILGKNTPVSLKEG